MIEYPKIAKTTKSIEKIDLSNNLCISINRLKYNNDSSLSIRLLSSFLDVMNEVLEDIKYKMDFKMNNLDFITIDNFNSFIIKNIPNISISQNYETTILGEITGYSKYTDKEYTLEYIENENDFKRHSFPCDMFFGEYFNNDSYYILSLSPYTKTTYNIPIKSSRITLRPSYGFNQSNIRNNKSVDIVINGISLTGKEISEVIKIESNIDYISVNEYDFINNIMSIGIDTTCEIILYPYELGDIAFLDSDIVDREEFDIHKCLLKLNYQSKELEHYIYNESDIEFPKTLDLFKSVGLYINGDIVSHYIDISNKLLYIVSQKKLIKPTRGITHSNKLYCYPLIIPKSYNKEIDFMKTQYQSIRVEYYEDTINKEYIFYVFPSHKTNDVETMDIYINGVEFESNILLDLYRENIETNKITIPFDELFKFNDDCIVEFRTYGLEECILPIYISNLKLLPLYVKNLNNIVKFSDISSSYNETTNINGYKQFISGNFPINEFSSLVKYSNIAQVMLNGYKINNIFKTFTILELENKIITHDTITNLYGNLNNISSVAGLAETGTAQAGV